MAQAYEYVVAQRNDVTQFASDLATLDAAGWEIIGFNTLSVSAGTPSAYAALLRRRLTA